MKRLYLAAALACVASSMMATTSADGRTRMFMAPQKAQATAEYEGLEIVNDIPEGSSVSTFRRNADVFYDNWGDLAVSVDDGSCGVIALAPNGEDVYIKNPISTYVSGSYIVGKKDGNRIRVNFPQKLYHLYSPLANIDENYYIQRLVLKSNMGGTLWYEVADDADNHIDFIIREDGSIVMEEAPIVPNTGGCPEFLMGMTVFDTLEDGETQSEGWIGYGDWNQVYTAFTESASQLPEGVKAENWAGTFWPISAKWEQDHKFFSVAFDGDDVYIGNIYHEFADAYIVGKRETTADGVKITFTSGQYLGVSPVNNHYCYFTGSETKLRWNSEYEAYVPFLSKADDVVFDYDEETGGLFTDGWITIMMGNANIEPDKDGNRTLEDEFVVKYYGELALENQGEFTPGVPNDPQWYVGPTFDDGSGYWMIGIPKTDVNGHLLDTSRLFYNIFLDDEYFYLYSDEIVGLEEDTCDIPYEFDNRTDVMVNGELHQIPYYVTGYENVYVQSFYKAEDGKIYRSGKVKKETDNPGGGDDPQPGAVEEIENGKTVVSGTWYDFSGRRVSNPDNGIYIYRVKYSDGSVKSSKITVTK